MPIIDADTHVHETEATFEFLRSEERELTPGAIDSASARYWFIDGHRRPRASGGPDMDAKTGTTVAMRELSDVSARIDAMNQMGVEVQVIYPTLFLSEGTSSPEVDLALRRSYNRWMAERCEQSGGRLRWVCLPPVIDLEAAADELRFAKAHGACGVLKKGDVEAGRWPNQEYFFPLYEEAERLDLPICFHLGSGEPKLWASRDHSTVRFYRLQLPVVQAFHGLLAHGIPSKFPALRFGFVEADASWVPFVLYDLKRRVPRATARGRYEGEAPDSSVQMVQRNNMYVSCQVDEDLPYIIQWAGEDNLMMGSDFTHSDASMEMDFWRLLQERADGGEISQQAVQKILYDNPKRFYGL